MLAKEFYLMKPAASMRRQTFMATLIGGLFIVALLVISPGLPHLQAQGSPTVTPAYTYEGRVNAPDFPATLDWLNVPAPLKMSDLRGKVVLLDFWTYGCINCYHIIPDLKRLEAEFGDNLVVVGVHSAKFTNEGNTENIRAIIRRYGIAHPVVNDKDFNLWEQYGVRAWPTVMVIDPLGKVLGYYSGEGVYDALQATIAGMISEFERRGKLDSSPITLRLEESADESPLAYPGKVLADAEGKRLFISDSNNNRIIVANLETYEILAVVGGAEAALRDGDYATAAFNYPHGLSLNGDLLYVADTGNHALRLIDLAAKTVSTIAGTGKQAEFRAGGGVGTQAALSSPWDVAYHDNALYIAMAGPHQIWKLDLATMAVAPFVGSGREGLYDSTLADAELAQPSAIVTDGQYLYFADAESSAIRKAELKADGMVSTIVGMGLFAFGDTDGLDETVRLQHPLGLALAADGSLYVADTYNDKIKQITPANRQSKTLFGSTAGLRDGKDPQFYEPGGLSYANGKLYVADTNNSLIRVIDVASGETTTVVFPNPELLSKTAALADTPPSDFFGDVVTLNLAQINAGAGTFTLNIALPDGYKMNDSAPFQWYIYQDNAAVQVAAEANNLRVVSPQMPLNMAATFTPGQATITMDVAIFYCEAVNADLCFPADVRFVLPLTVQPLDSSQPNIVNITYAVVPPSFPKTNLGN
jgi:DNA-binding beta-propeller fold protein YncE